MCVFEGLGPISLRKGNCYTQGTPITWPLGQLTLERGIAVTG